jgi:rod shape-determining protein MreC
MVETHSGRRFAVFFFVAAFLIFFLGRWIAPVDHVALSAAAPFQGAVSAVANVVGDVVSGVFQGPGLRDENLKLKKDLSVLLRQNIKLQQLTRDDALLRRIVNFHDNNKHLDVVVCRVIGQDSNALSPTIEINKGSRDGMRKSLTVLDQNGYFVGTIIDVNPLSSRVELMLSPSSSVGAIDLKTQAKGLVEGEFAATPLFDNVVVSSAIHPGDLIVTSGDYNLYPRTLLLGQVVSVSHQNVELFQKAKLQPAANFGELEMVQVVRNWVPSQLNTVVTAH